MTPVLEVKDLHVALMVGEQPREVLHGVSLAVRPGESIAVVGESGSGKSMTAKALLRILPDGASVEGEVRFKGADMYAMGSRQLNSVRAGGIGMIFQDPRAHINPVRSIGDFVTEGLTTNQGVSPSEAKVRTLRTLEELDVSQPEARLGQYPHELSGGLLQRIMIAAALVAEPEAIVADEPTTSLDVTTQSEVMRILDEHRRARNLALLLITHDLDLAAAVCDRTAVMYAGRVLEEGDSSSLHERPRHPYTAALAASRPHVEGNGRRLPVIPGSPLSSIEAPSGCPFAPRCGFAVPACRTTDPELKERAGGLTACLRADEIHEELVSEVSH